MLTKVISSAMVAAGMMAASPAFAGPVTISGSVTVSKGITLSCSISGAGSSSTAGSGTLTSLSLSGGTFGLCGSISFTGLPYAVSTSGGTLTITGVVVTAITGNCAGNLSGSYNSTTGVVTFNNATLPTTSGGSDCKINGSATLTPPI